MILVVTGTIGFDDLIKQVDVLVNNKKIKEKIIMQIGNSKYIPKNCDWFRFKPSLELYYKKAGLVIAHGGAATTFEVIGKGIKLISLDNPFRTDKHQKDLLTELSKNKNLLWCENLEYLDKFIEKSKNFKFKKYKKPGCDIDKEIIKFLN